MLFLAGFLALSVLYFADTLLRTTLKTFWFDELNTIYLVRLPSFASTWHAVLSGADFNPPLFYVLTRWSQHLGGGEGLIASRMPAILGFWIFGLCLYLFAARRLGPACGVIAACLPWFTLAHFYAYEARAHGLLLGWCGLMLVCWQQHRDAEDRRASSSTRSLWLVLFSLSWLAALLTHVYAAYLIIPFALVEADHLLRRQRPEFDLAIALIVPATVVAPLYLVMAHSYRAAIASPGIHIHPYEVVQHFLLATFGPALLVLLLAIGLFALAPAAPPESRGPGLRREEQVLAAGLLVLPLLGVILARLGRAPYFDRYFIDSTAGLALLLAQLASQRGTKVQVRAFLATMLVLISCDTLIAAWCHHHFADIDLVEPSSLLHFSPNPAQPLIRRASLLSSEVREASGDVLVTGHPDYIYLHYYAPEWLRSRLLFMDTEPNDLFLVGYHHFSQLTGIDLRTALLSDYLMRHTDFLIYEVPGNGCPRCDEVIVNSGFRLVSIENDLDGRLEHFTLSAPVHATDAGRRQSPR